MVRICCGNKLSNSGENSSGGMNFSRPWSPPNKKRQLHTSENKQTQNYKNFFFKCTLTDDREGTTFAILPLKVLEYLEVSETTAVCLLLV